MNHQFNFKPILNFQRLLPSQFLYVYISIQAALRNNPAVTHYYVTIEKSVSLSTSTETETRRRDLFPLPSLLPQ